jgi:hypothetical protein
VFNNKRIAVVIQGPMLSKGNAGSGTQNQAFDCATNVKRLLHESRAIVDGYVLSTWDDQTVNIQPHPLLKVLYLHDPGSQKTFLSRTLNNEFRQAFGCYEGVRYAVDQFSPDYVVKIRTDQYIDISALILHMSLVNSSYDDYKQVNQYGFLYFPNMLSWSPYSVGDFYIGGNARDLLNFFQAQVRYAKHSFSTMEPWVHSDIILRHAYQNLKDKLDLPIDYFFPNVAPAFRLDICPPPKGFKYHSDILLLWVELLRKSVCLYPKKVATSMEWRGSHFDLGKHSVGEFFEEWLDARANFKAWILKKHPNLYFNSQPIGAVDRFLNFCPEKSIEVNIGRPVNRRHLYSMSRLFFSFLKCQFPMNEFALKLWVWIYRMSKIALSLIEGQLTFGMLARKVCLKLKRLVCRL